MAFWDNFLGSGIKGAAEGIGSLAKDLRVAITGEEGMDNDLKLALEQIAERLEQGRLAFSTTLVKVQGSIINAEANSESWIARNWRPITMLTFVGLIVAHWMGWTAPNLTEPERLAVMDIIKIGLGGYVVGRSAEKVAQHIKK